LSRLEVGSNWSPCSSRPEPPPVLRVRADCGDRLFTAKLGVVVHYLSHQPLNHMLADDPILLACWFCDFLCDRVDDFIGFSGIDFVSRSCGGIFGEEVVDQFDDHAVKAGAFLVFSLS
jgi:hypothetical protein